jgi:hypothetical protein
VRESGYSEWRHARSCLVVARAKSIGFSLVALLATRVWVS